MVDFSIPGHIHIHNICDYIHTCNEVMTGIIFNYVILCSLLAIVSDHTEVISYYYPYLLQHMDGDSVSHVMHSNHLITDDDYQAISAAPNDWMMNIIILQYIRVMDLPTLLKFTDFLKTIETQNSIASYFEYCKYICT